MGREIGSPLFWKRNAAKPVVTTVTFLGTCKQTADSIHGQGGQRQYEGCRKEQGQGLSLREIHDPLWNSCRMVIKDSTGRSPEQVGSASENVPAFSQSY